MSHLKATLRLNVNVLNYKTVKSEYKMLIVILSFYIKTRQNVLILQRKQLFSYNKYII